MLPKIIFALLSVGCGVAYKRAASYSVKAAAADTGDKDADVLGQIQTGLLQRDEDGRMGFQGVQQVLRV